MYLHRNPDTLNKSTNHCCLSLDDCQKENKFNKRSTTNTFRNKTIKQTKKSLKNTKNNNPNMPIKQSINLDHYYHPKKLNTNIQNFTQNNDWKNKTNGLKYIIVPSIFIQKKNIKILKPQQPKVFIKNRIKDSNCNWYLKQYNNYQQNLPIKKNIYFHYPTQINKTQRHQWKELNHKLGQSNQPTTIAHIKYSGRQSTFIQAFNPNNNLQNNIRDQNSLQVRRHTLESINSSKSQQQSFVVERVIQSSQIQGLFEQKNLKVNAPMVKSINM